MAYITINADDFGITEGVTSGICRAIEEGIVTSTSAMACAAGAEKNIRQFLGATTGVIGAHLQLTGGKPVLEPRKIPSVTDKNGMFFPRSRDLPWQINPDEVYEEWKAQFYQLREWGVQPAYLDTHHNVHLQSRLLPVFAKLARELGLPGRAGSASTSRQLRLLGVSCPDITISEFFGEQISWEKLMEQIQQATEKYGNDAVIEVCCHPGYSGPELEAISYYTSGRENELEILTRAGGKNQIEASGFNFIGMNELLKLRPPVNIT